MTEQLDPEEFQAAYARLEQIATARGSLFALLAYAFFDPTPELVEQFIQGAYLAGFKAGLHGLTNREITTGQAQAAWMPLEQAQAELAQRGAEQALHEMKAEYTHLLIGPGRPLVSPYETAYGRMAKEGSPMLMVSPEALAVEAAYREAGIVVSSELREPPDHFATECEFVFYLANKEAESWAQGENEQAQVWRRRQVVFLEKHLGDWGRVFCRRVEQSSGHAFYRAAAHLAEAVLLIESRDAGKASPGA